MRTSPTSGSHLGAQPRRGTRVDRERQLPEIAGEDHAVLAARGLDRDGLVEHVVEHAVGRPGERVAPATAAAVVVLVALARFVLDVGGALARLVRLVAADSYREQVRRAR